MNGRVETLTVSWRVVNERGNPVSGAIIWVSIFDEQTGHGSSFESAISDAFGKYWVSGIKIGGNYTISAEIEGYKKGEIRIPSPTKDMTTFKDIVLKKAAK